MNDEISHNITPTTGLKIFLMRNLLKVHINVRLTHNNYLSSQLIANFVFERQTQSITKKLVYITFIVMCFQKW